MDKESYSDLLEALSNNTYIVILTVTQEGKLIDWVPASEYCTVQEARNDHDWPENAKVSLLYGLDALLQ